MEGWNDSDALQGIMIEHDSSDSKSSNLSFDSSTPLLDLPGSFDSQGNPSFLGWSNSRDLYYHQYTHSRLTSGQDAWNPLLVTGVPSAPISHMNISAPIPDQDCFSHSYTEPSENGSQYRENYPSADSGYDGRSCATQSVIASSYGVDSSSPLIGIKDSVSTESGILFDYPHGSNSCPGGSPSQGTDAPVRCDDASCTWVGKCPSDKRKHEARHKKLFKCDIPNCARKEGFGTINDLARHKKCVHNEEPERGPKMMYMCFGTNCPRPNKRWPRLDNFKQHLARMHGGENGGVLLKKSMDWYEKFIREPRHRFESSRDESGIEADLASVQSATDAEVNHASASQPNIFTFGAAPQPVHYDTSLADPGPLQSPGLGSLSFSATQDTSTERCIKSDGSVADAADNLISAMTKMMNNRGRKSSQTIDEGIDLESDNTLSQPQRQMLHKVLSVALERLSDENEATVQDTDSEKRSWFKCAVCSKQTRLRCEMKKHQKRHERPYGCTFPHCAKAFGSKADWKRHEGSQHLDIQSWFCTEHDAGKNASCERLFYRLETYTQHLRQHGVQEYHVAASASNNRLDLADQSHFWCGFCNRRVRLANCGQSARDERFNHIDVEHFKKGERGQDWRFPSSEAQLAQSENSIDTSKITDRPNAAAGQRKRKFSTE